MNKYRHLIDFNMHDMECEYTDVVIIGSGIAGLYTSLSIPSDFSIAILTKETLDISNSGMAQGGIAVSLDKEDSPELHFKDTIYAGAGLCDEESVWVLVNEAAQNIEELCSLGVKFDKKENMELALTREAAHSMKRIIHAGDTTGRVVQEKLISVVRTQDNIRIYERHSAIDILTEDGECKGIIIYDEDRGCFRAVLSNIVICATGGFGQLYMNTTNQEVATGDGLSIAFRAGAKLMDLEFIQFHPTVLYHPHNSTFLISEAVRGEGAVLKNIYGKRFMHSYHELGELAPRDVVSRSIFEEMKKTGTDNVLLDISFKGKEFLEKRFPNIYATCLSYGIDIAVSPIPVAPAEHYCMGGIKSDAFGRTDIKGFYTCGEAACNGIHGANRLASNSLLEGLVFGKKIGSEVSKILTEKSTKKVEFAIKYRTNRVKKEVDTAELKQTLRQTMNRHVGIVRSRKGLLTAKDTLEGIREVIYDIKNEGMQEIELQNMVLLAGLVIDSALKREESRGAHFREDYPRADDINWKRHIVV